jgi:hypothetical protein
MLFLLVNADNAKATVTPAMVVARVPVCRVMLVILSRVLHVFSVVIRTV